MLCKVPCDARFVFLLLQNMTDVAVLLRELLQLNFRGHAFLLYEGSLKLRWVGTRQFCWHMKSVSLCFRFSWCVVVL